jgi:hypothetical protein
MVRFRTMRDTFDTPAHGPVTRPRPAVRPPDWLIAPHWRLRDEEAGSALPAREAPPVARDGLADMGDRR